VEVGSDNQGKIGGLELLAHYPPESLAANAAKVAVSKLSAVTAPSGEFPVILGPGFGGVIFHEAIGHSLEADGIRKQVSVMRGKLGERLASPKVTLIDSGGISQSGNCLNKRWHFVTTWSTCLPVLVHIRRHAYFY